VDPPHLLRGLPAGARRDLLRVLTSPSNVRADVVRQFHERGDEGKVEILAELEADELLRLQVIDLLRQLDI
jgi:hypothetical protein